MRIFSLLLTFAIVLLAPRYALAVPPRSDLLLVTDLSDASFRPLRDARLANTPFDCGRVIVDSGAEYSVTVYSKRGLRTNEPDYWVTYINNDRSLRDVTDNGHRPEAAHLVRSQRTDAKLPKETAERVRAVWTRMLSGRHAPRPIEQRDATAVTDGISAEFSIERPDRSPLSGMLLDIRLPKVGSKTKMLVELSEDLVAYCRAKPNDRDRILNQIDKKASALLQRLR